MSTVPSTDDLPATPPSAVQIEHDLKACARCNQEMYCDGPDLPLHMDGAAMCLGSLTLGQASKGGKQIISPLTIPDVTQFSPSEVLSANTCWSCGGPKTPGQTICRTCHGFLPFIQQKCLPQYVKGYLFSDEHKLIAGHYTKAQFMDVFKSALEALSKLRVEQQQKRSHEHV